MRKLMDGYHAISRYYLNNFADAFKQDDYDIFLCNHRGPWTDDLGATRRYVTSLQRIQRRHSLAVSMAPLNRSTFLHYLLLMHRHLGPREIRRPWQFIVAMVWLMIIACWYLLFIRIGFRRLLLLDRLRKRPVNTSTSLHISPDTVVWREPRSGIKCWDGDDALLFVENDASSS